MIEVRLKLPDDFSGEEAVGALKGVLQEEFQKAVPLTSAHILPRDSSGRFIDQEPPYTGPRLTPDEQSEAVSLADEHLNVYGHNLSDVLDDLQGGYTTLDIAKNRGYRQINEQYRHLFQRGLQASGHPGLQVSPTAKAQLNRLIKDERDYWFNFMDMVFHGTGVIPYDKRVAFYANAGKEAYWLGFIWGDTSPSRRIVWVLGPTEHCQTCSYLASISPMTMETFRYEALNKGYLPQSGELACKGIHCQCSLRNVP